MASWPDGIRRSGGFSLVARPCINPNNYRQKSAPLFHANQVRERLKGVPAAASFVLFSSLFRMLHVLRLVLSYVIS